MANFGIGIGAFADGFTRGMNIGEKYRKAAKDHEIEKAQSAALDEAKAARDAHINEQSNVLLQGGPEGVQQPAPPPQPTVDGAGVQTSPVPTPNVQPQPGSSVATSPAAAGLPAQAAPVAVPPPGQSAPVPLPEEGDPAVQQPVQAPPAERTIETPPPAAGPEIKPAAAASVMGLSPQPASKEQARKAAEKSAPSVLEFMQKQGAPKVAEAYLRQGNIEKAEQWTKWAEAGEGKRTMKTWAKAWSATQRGDLEGAAEHVFELYKGFDDGSTPMSKETVKDKAGNITGFNIKLRNDATGEERDTFVGRDQLLDMGLTALSPPQMFEQAYKAKQEREKATAAAAAEVGKAKLKTAGEIAVERVRQGGRVEVEGLKSGQQSTRDAAQHERNLERDVQKSALDSGNARNKVQQELDAKIGALSKAGYSEEFIKTALPDILGVNQYKKTTSPEEAKRLAHSDRMKSDFSYASKTPEQQRTIIEQDMNLIYGGVKPSSAPSDDKGAPATPAAKGLPVLDKKTGQIIYK